MSMTIDAVLQNPLIAVVDRDDSSGYVCFRLGALKTAIEVWVTWRSEFEKFVFTQSHAIQARGQDAPYWTSRPYNDSSALALDQVISGLCRHYKWAIQDGHAPEETWLVPPGAEHGWPESRFLPPLST
jgi:hypothetical protein